MHGKWAGGLLVVMALVAGGCGESKPLTKAEFVQRANAVCARSHAQQFAELKAAVAQKEAQHLSEAQARAKLIPQITRVKQSQLKQLESLKPPTELQSTYVQWKAAIGTEITEEARSAPLTPAQHAQLLAFSAQRERLKSKLGVKC